MNRSPFYISIILFISFFAVEFLYIGKDKQNLKLKAECLSLRVQGISQFLSTMSKYRSYILYKLMKKPSGHE